MGHIITRNTTTQFWQELVQDAEKEIRQPLGEELESYLVFLLIRFTRKSEIATSVMAEKYLRGMHASGAERSLQLQDVGDQCLLYSGFFPKRARRRRVSIRYYVDLGQSSYVQVAESLRREYAHMYQQLAQKFVACMEVLNNICRQEKQDDLLLLSELWQESGSEQARHALEQQLDDFTLLPSVNTKH